MIPYHRILCTDIFSQQREKIAPLVIVTSFYCERGEGKGRRKHVRLFSGETDASLMS